MNPDIHITLQRLAVLNSNGFESVSDIATTLLAHMEAWGTESINKGELSQEQVAGVRRSIKDTAITYDFFHDMISRIDLPEEQRDNIHYMLVQMMDDLISLGSVLLLDKKAAKISRSVISGGSAGGIASVKARRKKREQGWELIARQMIAEIRAGHPKFSQDDVVSEVIAGWKHVVPAAPRSKSLKELVSVMERDGHIPRRQKA